MAKAWHLSTCMAHIEGYKYGHQIQFQGNSIRGSSKEKEEEGKREREERKGEREENKRKGKKKREEERGGREEKERGKGTSVVQ